MEDDQQFCLRWNNHQSTLVAVFDTLLENGTLVDCTLAAEGKYLNAHKVVLSACSPYFESLLSQNYDKHPIFILKDVKYQELKAMMDYMYRGEVNISQDQLGALLKAAESLQIKGLSDNRKGETETKKTVAPPPPPPVSKSPPPSAALPRVQGLTIEQRRREMEESREGSQSPGARKRKRIRRRSLEDIENHHDASNSSESHHSSSHAPAQNIPTALSAAAAAPIKVAPPSTDVPEPVESKSEILTRHKPPTAIVAAAAGDPEITQVPTKEKLETHSELMLEPKAEYIDEMNEDSIEDLTLDDDDISNMEQMDDSGAGPSHGNLGEASGQGFGGWHMGNQSQDEVFLAAQEAVGAHRDSQESVSEDGGDHINDDDRINDEYEEDDDEMLEEEDPLKLPQYSRLTYEHNYAFRIPPKVKRQMRDHVISVYSNRFLQCTLCAFGTRGNVPMQNHMKQVHGLVIPQRKKAFRCNCCDKSYSHKHSLYRHRRQQHRAEEKN
ncbi:longitudinals lacking protein, isoforms H/M/V isoform X6 [Onthophagus taurus]|uniref:longitudinals lacking protein, isoforms H/M/V isoform X6 n=1 Tax=Onthophagus taurus TaxID=166361 RepID=UPI000C20DE1A|nr:longitudinals lacking protein, isoforms H/M/V isoform X6 [Onthophagus taurus]